MFSRVLEFPPIGSSQNWEATVALDLAAMLQSGRGHPPRRSTPIHPSRCSTVTLTKVSGEGDASSALATYFSSGLALGLGRARSDRGAWGSELCRAGLYGEGRRWSWENALLMLYVIRGLFGVMA